MPSQDESTLADVCQKVAFPGRLGSWSVFGEMQNAKRKMQKLKWPESDSGLAFCISPVAAREGVDGTQGAGEAQDGQVRGRMLGVFGRVALTPALSQREREYGKRRSKMARFHRECWAPLAGRAHNAIRARKQDQLRHMECAYSIGPAGEGVCGGVLRTSASFARRSQRGAASNRVEIHDGGALAGLFH